MSSAASNHLKLHMPADGDEEVPKIPEESGSEHKISEVASDLPTEELQTIRAERLKAVQKAIAEGVYDSDELLDRAMQRLRKVLEEESDGP